MQVPEFTGFASALDSESYRPVPHDWLIAIGDVAGSTPAIAPVQNACTGGELPIAFGGDGGIVLVPVEQGSSSHR